MSRYLLIAVVVTGVLSGCGRMSAVRCEDPEYYAGSAEIEPVQVPEDLSLPDETESLQIPPAPLDNEVTETTGPCLESPPEFFEEASPG